MRTIRLGAISRVAGFKFDLRIEGSLNTALLAPRGQDRRRRAIVPPIDQGAGNGTRGSEFPDRAKASIQPPSVAWSGWLLWLFDFHPRFRKALQYISTANNSKCAMPTTPARSRPPIRSAPDTLRVPSSLFRSLQILRKRRECRQRFIVDAELVIIGWKVQGVAGRSVPSCSCAEVERRP